MSAYGSNADRLKKAMANHGQPKPQQQQQQQQQSISRAGSTTPVSSSSNRDSRYSSCSSSSSNSDSTAFQESVAHLLPYIHSNHSSITDTRRSTSSSNATTISSSSCSNHPSSAAQKSPKRLFEKRNISEAPPMVVTSSIKHSKNPDPYMLPPTTPVVDKDIGQFTDYVYEHEELTSSSDLFLPMRVQALNLDLDNVLHDALVSTIKHPATTTTAGKETDTISTSSSSCSRVLNYEQFDYDSLTPPADTAVPSTTPDGEESIRRKQSVRLGSKMKRFAKKIAT